MKQIIFFIFFTAGNFALFAQPYTVENGHTRHRFAQLEVGMSQFFSPKSGKTQFLSNDQVVNYQFNESSTSAIFIGGTHFWGHCDFALTIPVKKFGKGMRYAVDLQAKYFPLAIRHNKLRPYIGVSMNPFGYSQKDGATINKTYFPVLAGFNYSKKMHQFEIGLLYNYKNDFQYYISRTQLGNAQIQPFVFNATYKLTLETTGSAEKNWRNGTTAKRTEELAKAGKLNAFSVGIGFSSAFRIKNSAYLSQKYPFAGQHSYQSTLEYGLGYYWHKPDLQMNIAYRRFKSDVEAYGYTQQARRSAVTVELFKFLGDYHGFIPFVGPNLGYETLQITEQDFGQIQETPSFKGWKPGITFGWDIRPDRLQSWILRTNLRWQPNLNVTMSDGRKNALDQLEFNFIQLVVFPERMFGKKKI